MESEANITDRKEGCTNTICSTGNCQPADTLTMPTKVSPMIMKQKTWKFYEEVEMLTKYLAKPVLYHLIDWAVGEAALGT